MRGFRDIARLQWKFLLRNAAPQVSAGAAVVFALGTAFLPEAARLRSAAALAIIDPTALGLIFVGALILLEKSQGVSKALGAMPRGTVRLDLARVLLFSALSCACALAILLAGGAGLAGALAFQPWIALLTAFFTLVGAALAAATKRITRFMLLAALCLTPALPGLAPVVDAGGAWCIVSPLYPAALAAQALLWPGASPPFPAIAAEPLARGGAALALSLGLACAWVALGWGLRRAALRAMLAREAA